MTSIAMPYTAPSCDAPVSHDRSRWPWFTALVLFACFAAGCWAWNASQNWYTSTEGDVDALVDRIAEGQMSRQLGFAALGVYGMYLVFLPGERRLTVKPVLFYALICFAAWAFISPAWSVDRSQTMKRLVVFAALCLTITGIIKHYDIRQMAQIALIASVLTLLTSYAREAMTVAGGFPGFGVYRFGGMLHPNHAALNCTVVILSALYLFRLERRWWLLAFIALAAVALVLTKSRTALATCIVGVVAFSFLTMTTKRAMLSLLLCAWIGGGAALLDSMQMLPSMTGAIAMGRDDLKKQDPRELTGRTAIWKYAVMQAEKDPNRALIGYGFETFWTADNARGVSEAVKFKISEGHNVYLDWYLELGVIGAGLYGLLLLSALLRWTYAARVLASPSCALGAAICFAAIVHGLAESSLGDASLPTLCLYASIALATLARPDEVEAAL